MLCFMWTLRYFAIDVSVSMLLNASFIFEVLCKRRLFCQRPWNKSHIMEDFRSLWILGNPKWVLDKCVFSRALQSPFFFFLLALLCLEEWLHTNVRNHLKALYYALVQLILECSTKKRSMRKLRQMWKTLTAVI